MKSRNSIIVTKKEEKKMCKIIKTFLVIICLVLVPYSMQAQNTNSEDEFKPKLRIGLDAVGVWQALSQKYEPDTLAKLPTGFQAAVGNMHFNATIVEGIDVYFELYLSSKPHAGQVYDREGYVYISKFPKYLNIFNINKVFKYIDIKAGHFEVDFGNQHLIRSDNAQVQKNPLIGNYVVDPNTVEFGVELIGKYKWFNALFGVGSGVTVENFLPGRKYSTHGKIWIEPENKLFNLAGSVYRVNQPGKLSAGRMTIFTELFSGNRSGSRYSGVVEGGPEAGQIKLGKGQNLTAWQIDAAFNKSPISLSGMFGWGKDADLNGEAPGTPISGKVKIQLSGRAK